MPRRAPNSRISTTGHRSPGSITISVSGGNQVKLGSSGAISAPPRSYGVLTAGTYYGYARNEATDGWNTHDSAWDTCPARTIVDPVPATPGGFSSATHNRVWTLGPPSGELGIEVYTTWSAVANATKYEVQITYSTGGGPLTTYSTTGTNLYEFFSDSGAIVGSAQVSLRAGNSSGWSGWTSVYIPSTTGQITY